MEISKNYKIGWWSCGKDTKQGDFLFFYAMKPVSAIVATATAASNKRKSKRWHFVADIKNIKILERPITRTEMLKEIPNWGWPKQPRRVNYLRDPFMVKKLFKLANRKREGRDVDNPDEKAAAEIRNSAGAGFGDFKQNLKVELAACKAFKDYYKRKGYLVTSREKENIGYDFDVSKNGETLHVEVKGISGSGFKFPITANEVACAKSDSKFHLAVVSEATTPRRKVHVFTRNEFQNGFGLKPLAYFAEIKR